MATEIKGVMQSTGEIRTHYFDFTNDLPTSVTVTSATAVHTPPSGTATTPTVGTIQEGRIVPVTLGAQSATGTHYLTVTATLSDGQKSIIRVEIKVVWASITGDMKAMIAKLRRHQKSIPTKICGITSNPIPLWMSTDLIRHTLIIQPLRQQ